HQIKLKSAFRLAIIGVALIGGYAAPQTSACAAGEDLIAMPTFNTDDINKPQTGITYLWQSLQGGAWTDLTSTYTGYNTAKLLTVKGTDMGISFRCKITHNSVSKTTNALTMA
ncbi:MAG: hypothetical protein RSG53_08845, partial [Oscillospiraceae bacterium]